MCFEMLFGKYQLKGKKGDNAESILFINDDDNILCTDIYLLYVFFLFIIWNHLNAFARIEISIVLCLHERPHLLWFEAFL